MGLKYNVNEDFFKRWSVEMAYVLGYIYADGSLEDASYLRGKYLRVSSIDKINIERIKKWLGSEHRIVQITPASLSHKTRYLLRIGSHRIYDDLTSLGLYPNKSLSIKFPTIPDKHLKDFIRGYFDGDGCVRIWMSKGIKQDLILRKLCTIFTCGSEQFLKALAEVLCLNIGTRQLSVYKGHRSYMLSYSTDDSVKIFRFMYGNLKDGTCLERKVNIYSRYFSLRPERVDKEVKNILQSIHCR